MAHIAPWAPALFLGLQQGASHEATAKNRLFLCKLQESPGDLWRGSQTGVVEEGEGSRAGTRARPQSLREVLPGRSKLDLLRRDP